MKKFWKKYRMYIVSSGYIVMLVLLVWMFFIPRITVIKQESDQVQEKVLDEKIANSRIAELSEIEKRDQNFESKKEKLDVFLKNDREIEYIKKLEEIAEITGNSISFKIEEEEEDEKTTKKKETSDIKESIPLKDFLEMEIILVGDFQNIFGFIYKLENMHPYTNIISLDLASGIQSSEEGRSSIFRINSSENEKLEEISQVKAILKVLVYKE